jgi:hypothetical protein
MDALDGEEFTNEILNDGGSGDGRRPNQQMWPIGADFKHFFRAEFDEFRHICKVSSIMRAKVLSIMPVKGSPVTSD